VDFLDGFRAGGAGGTGLPAGSSEVEDVKDFEFDAGF
jgi:hypothetical protein